jgi:hypothetical protein
MMLRFAKQLPTNKRTKIIEAVHLICSRYEADEPLTTIMMPPRYGKSSVIRLGAMELHATTKLPAVMMAPWSDNVDQIKETEPIKDMYECYGIPAGVPFTSHRCRALKSNNWWKTEQGIPTLITCTIGLLNNAANQQQFFDGLDDMRQRLGKRIPIFVDEAHLIKELQVWGKFIHSIVVHGSYIVLLTGTPVPGIPGFKQDADDWIDTIRHIPRRRMEAGEIKHFLETYEGQKRTIRNVIADLNVSWDEAWSIDALARVNAVWIDVEVFDKDTKESLGMLSGLPKTELNGRLRSIEESEEMVAKKADAAVDRFFQLRMREHTKVAQVLVVTGSDWANNNDGSNVHARAYKAAIREAILVRGYDVDDFTIEIATGVDKDGNPDANSTGKIKDFRKGKIQFLIVKLMGIVGLDVPACKILLFGSTLRNGPMAIQALSRVLTTWHCRANMILSNDAAMVELYTRVIKDQGGEQTESNLHLVDIEEIPEPPEKPVWGFKGAKVSSYGDEKGGTTIGDYELELRIIKAKYHTNGLSDRQIIENFVNGGFPFSDEDRKRDSEVRTEQAASGIRDLDEGLEEKVGKFGLTAKQIVSRYVNYPSDKWREKVIELQRIAKELCGVPYRKVGNIDDAALLQRLIDALPHAEQVVFGHGQSHQENRSA